MTHPQREHYSTGETCITHESCSGDEADCRTERGTRPLLTAAFDGVAVTFPGDEAHRVADLVRAADEGGTIQAAALVPLFPGEPQRHTTASLRTALGWIGARLD